MEYEGQIFLTVPQDTMVEQIRDPTINLPDPHSSSNSDNTHPGGAGQQGGNEDLTQSDGRGSSSAIIGSTLGAIAVAVLIVIGAVLVRSATFYDIPMACTSLVNFVCLFV